MNLLQKKIERLKNLESRVKSFSQAIEHAESRESAGKEVASERFAVWSSCGNNRVSLDASHVFRGDDLIKILSARVREAEKEISQIRPVIEMAERVLVAEENAQ